MAHLNLIEDTHALLGPAQRVIRDLSNMAGSARSLPELQQIDQFVTRDVFDSLCDRGVPMPLVSELVWPAVAAMTQRASLLEMSWKPALSHRDQAAASSSALPQDWSPAA